MKIAVCVKQIPEGNSRIDPGTKRLDRSGEGALNAFDANAVEEALRLKDADRRGRGRARLDGAGEGAGRAAEGARDGRRPGRARSVTRRPRARISSRRATRWRRRSSARARTSSCSASRPATRTARCCGRRSPTGCACPVVSQAAEITHADGKLTVKRQTEFGYDVIEAPLPAVVAVSDAINEPRYPSLKGIMGAKSKPQETVTLADLGVEADRAGEQGSRTEVMR